jgi:hypothetical protein
VLSIVGFALKLGGLDAREQLHNVLGQMPMWEDMRIVCNSNVSFALNVARILDDLGHPGLQLHCWCRCRSAVHESAIKEPY